MSDCRYCDEEAEYKCMECKALMCDAHTLVSGLDDKALCLDCDETIRSYGD